MITRLLSIAGLRDILILVALVCTLMLLGPKFISRDSSQVVKAKELCFRGERVRDETLKMCAERVIERQKPKNPPKRRRK